MSDRVSLTGPCEDINFVRDTLFEVNTRVELPGTLAGRIGATLDLLTMMKAHLCTVALPRDEWQYDGVNWVCLDNPARSASPQEKLLLTEIDLLELHWEAMGQRLQEAIVLIDDAAALLAAINSDNNETIVKFEQRLRQFVKESEE